MKLSLNWIKQFTDINLPSDELVARIGARLGEIEEVIDWGARYRGILAAKVVSVTKHPNADKLHICQLDDGGVTKHVPRGDNGLVQVVTGAPNIKTDMMVAWLPPGTTVPSTYAKEPFVLEARELRGVLSQGMLGSARELMISDDHSGIMEIDYDCQPGASLAEVYQLDDQLIEVENKMFTHRPDCFGILGVARELAGIQGIQFKSPEWYQTALEFKPLQNNLSLRVDNQLPNLVPRFMAVAIQGIKIQPSPVMMQSYLSRVGIKPINNVVDVTNFVMYLTGQPLHAYDYDKLKALDQADYATLVVRHPQAGEKVALLNGKQIEPHPKAIMIASASQLIGVGGIMGGTSTEVDGTTTNIVLECATFDMYSIRRTSMAHGLFTDAVTRFSKGQSPHQTDKVLAYAGRMICDLTPSAEFASEPIDNKGLSSELPNLTVTSDFINQRLGLQLSAQAIQTILTNVEFSVQADTDQLHITAPFWRTDIHIREDVVEEIGRLYGYDNLPLVLPRRELKPPAQNALFEFKQRLRSCLSRCGANEVLTYSFVHGNLLDKVGQDKTRAFQLSNALSPDLQYYRLSLTPSLLEKVHPNLKADLITQADKEFAIFEMNKTHCKEVVDQASGLPQEFQRLALVVTASDKAATKYHGAAFYQAKAYLQSLLGELNVTEPIVFEPLQPETYRGATAQLIPMYQPNRAAVLRVGDVVLGEIGEYRPSVRQGLKLPAYTAGFELDLTVLQQLTQPVHYRPLPKCPKTQQDISFKVPSQTTFEQIQTVINDKLANVSQSQGYHFQLSPLDIYQTADDSHHKHIAFRIWLWHDNRTLTTLEANNLLNDIAIVAHKQLQASRL